MPGTQRYWDGGAWSDHVAPVATAEPRNTHSAGRGVIIVAVGILVAVAVVWFVTWLRTPSDFDCAIQRVEVANGSRDAVQSACIGRQ